MVTEPQSKIYLLCTKTKAAINQQIKDQLHFSKARLNCILICLQSWTSFFDIFGRVSVSSDIFETIIDTSGGMKIGFEATVIKDEWVTKSSVTGVAASNNRSEVDTN